MWTFASAYIGDAVGIKSIFSHDKYRGIPVEKGYFQEPYNLCVKREVVNGFQRVFLYDSGSGKKRPINVYMKCGCDSKTLEDYVDSAKRCARKVFRLQKKEDESRLKKLKKYYYNARDYLLEKYIHERRKRR